jgi:hypothetical protein
MYWLLRCKSKLSTRNKLPIYKTMLKHAQRYNWATLFLGEINTGTWGFSKIETNYAHESRGTQIWERLRWRCPIKLKSTDPTSRQRGCPTSTNPRLLKKNNQRENGKNWSRVADGCLTLGRTARLSVVIHITLTLTLIWTFGIQLWGAASTSNIDILERFQSKALRMIVDAPWYVPKTVIRRNLQITNSVALVRERTIPNKRPPLVAEVSANFCG